MALTIPEERQAWQDVIDLNSDTCYLYKTNENNISTDRILKRWEGEVCEKATRCESRLGWRASAALPISVRRSEFAQSYFEARRGKRNMVHACTFTLYCTQSGVRRGAAPHVSVI
jgi:hypothetical protein